MLDLVPDIDQEFEIVDDAALEGTGTCRDALAEDQRAIGTPFVG